MMTGKSCLQLSTSFRKQTYQKWCKGKEGCREDRGWGRGRGGGEVKVISPLDGGGQKVILTFIQN